MIEGCLWIDLSKLKERDSSEKLSVSEVEINE